MNIAGLFFIVLFFAEIYAYNEYPIYYLVLGIILIWLDYDHNTKQP